MKIEWIIILVLLIVLAFVTTMINKAVRKWIDKYVAMRNVALYLWTQIEKIEARVHMQPTLEGEKVVTYNGLVAADIHELTSNRFEVGTPNQQNEIHFRDPATGDWI